MLGTQELIIAGIVLVVLVFAPLLFAFSRAGLRRPLLTAIPVSIVVFLMVAFIAGSTGVNPLAMLAFIAIAAIVYGFSQSAIRTNDNKSDAASRKTYSATNEVSTSDEVQPTKLSEDVRGQGAEKADIARHCETNRSNTLSTQQKETGGHDDIPVSLRPKSRTPDAERSKRPSSPKKALTKRPETLEIAAFFTMVVLLVLFGVLFQGIITPTKTGNKQSNNAASTDQYPDTKDYDPTKTGNKQSNNAASTDQYPDLMDYDAVQEFARNQSPDVQKAIASVMNSTFSAENSAESTDPREQAIRDRNKISAYDGNEVFSLFDEVAGDMEVEARRQQRAYAEKVPPEIYNPTKEILSNLGNRRYVLDVLRQMTPEQQEEVMRLAPGIAQQFGDDRFVGLVRCVAAFSRGVTHGWVNPIMEIVGIGGTAKEIAFIRRLDEIALQEFHPYRPGDPWYERVPLQAIELLPWVLVIGALILIVYRWKARSVQGGNT